MTFNAYTEANLPNRFIQWSSSPAVAPILFTKKTDAGLRLCVNCHVFNTVMEKNQDPLLLISEVLDPVRDARIFTNLDLLLANNLIQNQEGNEYKMYFRTHYCQFEYQIMLLGLTNAPATLQS
jgi:hypothetical protein